MKSRHVKKINIYAASIMLISSIFMTITSANAELVTFKFEGVITRVGDESSAAIAKNSYFGSLLRIVDDDEIEFVDKFTGYEPGDKFTGKYTFETESPSSEYQGDLLEYDEAIRRMSFVSGKNTLTAEHGTITQSGHEDFDAIVYSVEFSPLVAGGGILTSPSTTPRDLNIEWISDLPRSNLPPLDGNPHFDTNRIVRVDGGSPFYYNPLYGSISFSFNYFSTIESVHGVIHSIEVVPTEPPPQAETDLVAHWPLNEGEGSIANDISGNSHNGTLTNDPTWLNGDDIKLSFNGNDDFVNIEPLDVFGNTLTLTGKVESNELDNCNSNDCRILSKASGTARQDHYWMLSTIKVGNKTRLRFRLKTNGRTSTLIASSGNLTNGVAFHAAATYDGTTMRIYKNGVEVGNLPKTGNIDTNNTTEVWIGDNPDIVGSRPWKGIISDVRIYKKALTEEEIDKIAN